MSQCQFESTKETVYKEYSTDQEEEIKSKMEELRRFSHPEVTDAKLRQGALLALGLKKWSEVS